MNARSSKLGSLQAARGIAALLVAFFHAHLTIRLPGYFGQAPFGGFFGFGHAGVEFFFVLSGFIIFHVHCKDLGDSSRLPHYAWKRITRIYPIFLVVMTFYAVKAIWLGEFQWPYFLKSLFFIPQIPFPMLSQSWTLVHEMLFYAIFGLSIVSTRLGMAVMILWIGTIILTFGIGSPVAGHPALDVAASLYNVLFLIGIAAAWLARGHSVFAPRMIAAAGFLCFLGTGLAENTHVLDGYPHQAILMYGVSSGLLLLGLVRAETLHLIATGATADILGNISYPLYLVHGGVLSVAIGLAKRFTPSMPPWLVMIAGVLIACIVAYILHLLVERPAAQVLNRLSQRNVAPGSKKGIPT